MSRASWAVAALLAVVARGAALAKGKHEPVPTVDPHAALADQLAAERDTLDRTVTTVAEKLSAADAQRVRRIRAAYRLLHAPLAPDASADDRMVHARRRAGARLMLARDTAERSLLAGELARLDAARTVTVAAAAKLPTIALPDALGWPAKGKIARHFGALEHEKSHATLSRRGLEIEVEDHAPAFAIADGIVRYAGPIRGLDHGVIVDHGDYLTVIAKLSDLSLPVGAHVARGDRLGRAARHRVYLEVRAAVGPGGLPIDPEPLLAKPM